MIRPVNDRTDMVVSPRARSPKGAHKSFRKVEVRRLMDVARASGMVVESVEVRPDGTIRLSAGKLSREPGDDLFYKWDARLRAQARTSCGSD